VKRPTGGQNSLDVRQFGECECPSLELPFLIRSASQKCFIYHMIKADVGQTNVLHIFQYTVKFFKSRGAKRL
jgi:hypothetical protein